MYSRRDILDLVLVDGKARGVIARNLVTGEIERYSAHAVILATGGYGTVYYLSTLAVNSNASMLLTPGEKVRFLPIRALYKYTQPVYLCLMIIRLN